MRDQTAPSCYRATFYDTRDDLFSTITVMYIHDRWSQSYLQLGGWPVQLAYGH